MITERRLVHPRSHTPEIHGYKPDYGYRVYTEKAIEMVGQSDGVASMAQRPLVRAAAERDAEPKMEYSITRASSVPSVDNRSGGGPRKKEVRACLDSGSVWPTDCYTPASVRQP